MSNKKRVDDELWKRQVIHLLELIRFNHDLAAHITLFGWVIRLGRAGNMSSKVLEFIPLDACQVSRFGLKTEWDSSEALSLYIIRMK